MRRQRRKMARIAQGRKRFREPRSRTGKKPKKCDRNTLIECGSSCSDAANRRNDRKQLGLFQEEDVRCVHGVSW
jgi:hypothetical protein